MADRARTSGGFTLIELAIAIIIITVLASMLLVIGGRIMRESRVAGERQFLVSLKTAVDQFKQQFGFLPPLVQDGPPTTTAGAGPLTTTNPRAPLVRPDAFLRSAVNPGEPRYSEYSLSYYVLGMLDVSDNLPASKPIDGVEGPGFTAPQRDGSFAKKGPTIQPYIDPARGRNRVYRDPMNPAKVKITDRWGNAVRFYRWLPRPEAGAASFQYLVPRAVGDPNTEQGLRGAEYAIVSLGPDNLTDDRKPLPTAGKMGPEVDAAERDETVKDDIVEAGR